MSDGGSEASTGGGDGGEREDRDRDGGRIREGLELFHQQRQHPTMTAPIVQAAGGRRRRSGGAAVKVVVQRSYGRMREGDAGVEREVRGLGFLSIFFSSLELSFGIREWLLRE